MHKKIFIVCNCLILCFLSGCNTNNKTEVPVTAEIDPHITESYIEQEGSENNAESGSYIDQSGSENYIVGGSGNEINHIEAENITVYVDKVATKLEDVNGREVMPFVDNAEVYVPITSLGNILEKPVEWDSKNKAVYVGESPNRITYMQDIIDGYDSQRITEYSFLKNKGAESFTMASIDYSDGMVAYSSWSGTASINFNLNGKYSNLSFKFGHLDGTEMYPTKLIVKLDGYVKKEIEVQAEDYPIDIELDVSNALQLRFEIDITHDTGYAFADMILTESGVSDLSTDSSTAKE